METVIRKLKELLKNKEIIDIIIFGSSTKGKARPQDIDLAVLVKEKNQLIKLKIQKSIPKADVILLSLEDLHKSIFFTLVKEGYSVSKNDYLHNLYHTTPMKLFKYELKKLKPSQKVMFERALKNFMGINKLSNRVVLVPLQKSGEFEDFLKHWNIDLDVVSYELVPLMRKEEI